jgi:ATP-dependent DNA helicase RecG
MRPEILNPLFASVRSLSGIGSKLAGLLQKLLGTADEARVVDLLWHLPSGCIDRRFRPAIADAPEGAIVTLDIVVGRHQPSPRHNRRVPYRIRCHDHSGEISLVFFHAHADYLQKMLPEGERRFVSGRIEHYSGTAQMPHPDLILTPEEFEATAPVEPVYPLTAGLAAKTLRKAVQGAVETCPAMPEWQDRAWLARHPWSDFRTAIRTAHAPEDAADLEPASPARMRLAYDELLANQLALALMRARLRKATGQSIAAAGRAIQAIRAALPFSLTPSQEAATAEIIDDMARPERMLRLLQGDVGSGKTVVALLAAATAVEAGFQAAFMAPTEILARQHLATIEPLCTAAGLTVALLTGREKGKARDAILADVASGRIDILVGTHALFQEAVAFANLGVAVIDEQHRFGVHQRLALQAKGKGGVDVLVMTATPIPRTLTLTRYGDMDVSRLTDKPAGRKPVATRVMPVDRVDDVISGLARPLSEGARVYWVCPLVEESEEVDATDAEARFRALDARFPGRTGLIHGRMKGDEKDAVMARFQSGEVTLLVATTVIEVGVDVPEASIMVIEHAERFGLAQLHQLRGRVGRGTAASSCLLLYQAPLGEVARARLEIMRETDDGFRIAEEDLRLRGAGELLGTRQSGLPEFRVADLAVHGDLLAAARDDAHLLLADDPQLAGPRGDALRVLLYLFERDEAVRLLAAG